MQKCKIGCLLPRCALVPLRPTFQRSPVLIGSSTRCIVATRHVKATSSAHLSISHTPRFYSDPNPQRASTVDQGEIARLSESEHLQWWDPEGQMKPLHRMNPKRVAYIRNCLIQQFQLDPQSPTALNGLRIVDIGCGPGLLAEVHTFLNFIN